MSGIDTRLADALFERNLAAAFVDYESLWQKQVKAVLPLVEEARAEGYKQGRAENRSDGIRTYERGYAAALADATTKIKAAIAETAEVSDCPTCCGEWRDEFRDVLAVVAALNATQQQGGGDGD